MNNTHMEKYKEQATEVFKQFLDVGNVQKLLSALGKIDTAMRKEYKGADKNMWFRFFEGDTGATTISNIERDLEGEATVLMIYSSGARSKKVRNYALSKNGQHLIEKIIHAVENKSLIINWS